MKGFFFPVHWPENHPSSPYETLGEMGGWVYVAKPYLLVVYLSSQLRDLRSVYTGGPKPSTEGGTQDFDTGTGFTPLSCVGKTLSLSLFLILPNTSLASGTLRKMNAAT